MSEPKKPSCREQRLRSVSAQQDNVSMLLTQLGAEVREIHGLVCFVRFRVGGEELLYVYNLNVDNEYYLQRAKPYPMSAGVFPTAEKIAEYIERDLRAFQNAMNSGHFAEFVDLGRRITALSQGLEDAFFRYNISGDCFAEAGRGVEKLEQILKEMKDQGQPLQPGE